LPIFKLFLQFVSDGGARGQTRKSWLAATARGCKLKLVKMQTGRLLVYALATLAVVNSSAWAAPATPSSKLDEQGFWKAWLLYEEPAQPPEEGGRRKGQIQPKSIFIAPVIKDLPDCAPGYQADALGRCNKLVKVNQGAQLSFLLQKLNAMYATADKLVVPKGPTTTEGPLQFNIPIAEAPDTSEEVKRTTSTTTTTTAAPTTTSPEEEEVTELAEVMVVAAQVELQDENKSTSLPGAIVTLWHLNESTTTTPEITETETEVPTEMTTQAIDAFETTPPPTEVDTQPSETTTDEVDTTVITTMSPPEETTRKVSTMRPIHVAEQIISKPSEPDSVIEAEFYPEEGVEVEEPESEELEPQTPPQTEFPREPTSPVDLRRPYPDPVVFERPTESEVEVTDQTGDNSNPPLRWGQPSAKLEDKPVPSIDRVVFPQERLRVEGGASPATASTTPWSWGTWQRRTTPRPLLLNFYSHLPQVSHNQGSGGGVRTHLSHPSVYPAPGRHTPLFYQELTGHDVANVLGRPWRHHRNY